MRKMIFAAAVLLASVRMYGISLEECQRLSKENYPMIKQYELTEAMSQFSFRNAAMGYAPRITLGGQATYQSDVTDFPEVFTSLMQAMGTDVAGLSRDQYKLQLEISQTIWDGGYSKAQREAVKAQNEVSLLTIDKDIDALEAQVNQMYFGILMLEINLEANMCMDTLLVSNLAAAKSAASNGTALQSDLDNIRVELLTLRQQRSQLERSLRTYKDMLALMIGRKIEDDEVFEVPSPVIIDTSRNERTELRLFDAQMIPLFAQELDYSPEPDTISLLMRNGFSVREVQVEMRERTAGESYLNFTKSVSYMLRTSISILLVQWFRKKK